MLPDSVIQLLRAIYADEDNEEVQQKLRDDPEELLVSLLAQIKEDLPVVSATLQYTVEAGAGNVLESVKKRRAEAAKKKKELAKK